MPELAIRLLPGDDLRASLEAYTRKQDLAAGYILAAVGSLQSATIRFAGMTAVTQIPGPLEIVSLSGTLSPAGIHVHIAVADGAGQVSGGHLCAGSPVYTTAEIVLGTSSHFRFTREPDPRTGFRELVILDKNGTPR